MRKGIKYIVSIFLFVCALLSVDMTPYAYEMSAENSYIIINDQCPYVGETTDAYIYTNAYDAEYTVTWWMEDESIATIDENCVITALKKGDTKLYAKIESTTTFTISQEMHIQQRSVSHIALSTEETLIDVGDTFQLEATITPSNATYKTLKWSSTREEIATVDENGLVTAKKPGTTYIRVEATDDSGTYADCMLHVLPVSQPESGVELYKNNMYVGTYTTINKAFDKMTDTNGAYTVHIYSGQLLTGYAQWPKVKSIEIIPRLEKEDYGYATNFLISEKYTTFNSDVTFSDWISVLPNTRDPITGFPNPDTYYMDLQGYTLTLTEEIIGHNGYFGWGDEGGFHISGGAGSKIVKDSGFQFICSSIDVETLELVPWDKRHGVWGDVWFCGITEDCRVKNLILDGEIEVDGQDGKTYEFIIDKVSDSQKLTVQNGGGVDIKVKQLPAGIDLMVEYETVYALETGSFSYTGTTVPKGIEVRTIFNSKAGQTLPTEGPGFMPLGSNRALLYAPNVPQELVSFMGRRESMISVDDNNTYGYDQIWYEGTIESESGYYYSENIPTVTPSQSIILASKETSGTILFNGVNKNGDFKRVEWKAETHNISTYEYSDTTDEIIGYYDANTLNYTYPNYGSNYVTYLIGTFTHEDAVIEVTIPMLHSAAASNVSFAVDKASVVMAYFTQYSIKLNYTASADTKMIATVTNADVLQIADISNNELSFYTMNPGTTTLRVYIGDKVAECTITVLPELKTYKITYELNGGTNHKDNPAEYHNVSGNITLKNPSRKGYTFGGWYSDSSFKNKVTKIAEGSTGAKKLYAKWTANKYSIKFDKNSGASGTMANKTDLKYGTTYTLTTNVFKRKGYTFAGWNTKADGTGTAYADGAKVKSLTSTNGKTITLYAQWKKTKYAITYKLNGGKNNASNPASFYVTTATITLKSPSRTGYTFAGWYKESSFKTKVTTIVSGSTGGRTLYAKWTPKTYNIQFNGNGAKNTTMKKLTSRKYGTSYTLPANTYKKTGYTFVGWNTRADGKGTTYKNKASIKNLTSTNGKTVILYAKWQKTKYTITYVLNGGKNDKDNPSKYYITTSTIKLDNPTRKGYTFKGWYKDSKFKSKVSKITKGSTGNKKFYAKWQANDYDIKFKGNGATSGSMSRMTNRKYGTTYTLKSNAFKRKGYVFVGWNTRADGKGTSYKNKASIKNLTSKDEGTVTLYAQWKKK